MLPLYHTVLIGINSSEPNMLLHRFQLASHFGNMGAFFFLKGNYLPISLIPGNKPIGRAEWIIYDCEWYDIVGKAREFAYDNHGGSSDVISLNTDEIKA